MVTGKLTTVWPLRTVRASPFMPGRIRSTFMTFDSGWKVEALAG